MKYRIFVNDRPNRRGVRMYSAFTETDRYPTSTLKRLKNESPRNMAAPIAISWPASRQSDDEKEWLRVHVDGK